MNAEQLRKAIRKIADIEQEGLLGEVYACYRHKCKLAGGEPSAEWRERIARQHCDHDVSRIAEVASSLLNLPGPLCEESALRELAPDPFTVLAMEAIDEIHFTLPPAPMPLQDAKPSQHRKTRKW